MDAPVQVPLLREQSDTIDVAEITGFLRRRFWVIAAFVATSGLLALLHVLFAVPQFTARGALYLGDAQSAGGGTPDASTNLGFAANFTVSSDVETQVELITTKALVQQALLETGLNAEITPTGAPEPNYWRWRFREHGQISAYAPGPDTLQALYASTPGKFKVVIGEHETYSLFYPDGLSSPNSYPILTGSLGQAASGNGVEILIRPATPDFDARPGKVYDLKVSPPGSMADGLLGGALTVNAGGSVAQPTKIAFLQFRWQNPYQAAAFLNQVMQDFIATQLSWKTESASTTESFVSDQLTKVSASLAAADQNLATYQANTGILDVSSNAQTIIAALAQYQSQRSLIELQQAALRQLYTQLEDHRKPLNPYLISQSNDTILAGMTSSLSNAEIKLTEIQTDYTEGSEEVKLQEATISALQNAIITVVGNDLDAANKSLNNLDSLIAEFQSKIKTMPAEALKVISLQRSTDVLGKLYVLLMEREQEAEVSKAATIINTRIVTRATAPDYATAPKGPISVVFGSFVGLVAGVGLLFGKRALSGRFESEEEIRRSTDLQIFGAIPKQTDGNNKDLMAGGGNRSFSEAFRLLRGSVYRSPSYERATIVLVISPAEASGTTTIAANLAKALADDGRRVVLVDGDMYGGRLGGISKKGRKYQPRRKAVETRLISNQSLEDNFQVVLLSKLAPRGADVSTGPVSAPLNEAVLKKILAELRASFEFIILDSPPLPRVADGMTLGLFADLILSVVSVARTNRRSFARHCSFLDLLNRPHGVVINYVELQKEHRGSAWFDLLRRDADALLE